MKRLPLLGLATALLVLTAQSPARAAPSSSQAMTPLPLEHPWWIAGELHLSILSNLVDRSTINISMGYAAKSGYRWTTDWGVYFQVEHNLWLETEVDVDVKQGVVNIGVGAERFYFGRRMRAALAIGPSILLYETALDDRGTTGLFFDIRPTGLRWPVGKGWGILLDPLTFTVEAPALTGIPLVQIQYRTVLGVEYGLGR